MFIEDYMSADPLTVREDAPLTEASRQMHQHAFRQLPVVDESRRLVGIITDRDIRQTVGWGKPISPELTVSELMTPDPLTISVSATLDEAVELLLKHKYGALPVVRSSALVGIITYIDALRALANVFGLDQPGQRVELALPEGFADVARAFHALRDCNSTLLAAVVSRTRRDGGEPALYLRVAQSHARDVERRLRDATLVLLKPEHD